MRIVVLIVLVCSVYSIRPKKSLTALKQEGAIYDVVKLEVILPPGQRTKKSVDIQQLPHSLQVKFKANADNFHLRLRRTVGTNIPVYKLNNGELIRQNIRSIQSAAVYEDVETGSHVLVEKRYIRNQPQYTLKGHVVLGSSTYSIQPQNHEHVLRNVDTYIDFGNDEIFTDDFMTPILNTAQKKAEIDKIVNGKTSADTFTIEILFVADHTLRKRFLKQYYAEEVDSIMEKYFQLLLYSLQKGMDSVSKYYPKVKVVMEMSGLIILDRARKAPFLTRNIKKGFLEMDPALDSFMAWLQKQKSAPKHDHGMWLTGLDVARDGDQGVVGAALMGGLCTPDKVSLIEDDFSGITALTMIHELGHNLDAQHDVDHEKDGCSDDDMNIMASIGHITIEKAKSGNPYRFSYCSATDIVHYLYKEEKAKCSKIDNNGKTVPLKPQRAGQYFSADEQCQMSENNTESYFCRYRQSKTSFDNMCVNLFCYSVEDKECLGENIAYEYTSCGNKKWCVQGRCVRDDEAPSREDNCPQLDEFGVECDYYDCYWYNAKKKAKCCDTCANGDLYYYY